MDRTAKSIEKSDFMGVTRAGQHPCQFWKFDEEIMQQILIF